MKTVRLTILFLLSPLVFFAQTLTGLWMGNISNDSTTIRKDQSFEIVLTQYKNKVYGFSRSTFIVNDTLFYIVKRVLGTIEGDVCEVKDDDVVSYNFKGRLDKKVKMVTTFHLDQQDSAWKMVGDWKTNKTKKYYSVSGKMALKEEKDLEQSKIFPHLEELKLADEVAFYKEDKETKKTQEVMAAVKQPVKEEKKEGVNKSTSPPVASSKEPPNKETINTPAKSETIAKINDDKKQPQPVKAEEKQMIVAAKDTRPALIVKEEKPAVSPAVEIVKDDKVPQKQQPEKTETVVSLRPLDQKKDIPVESNNNTIKKQEPAPVVAVKESAPKPVTTIADIKPAIPQAAAMVAERKIAPPQIVNFRSDSLELALYDNGEVDGDTVSVLLNGEIILPRQGLKASAIKKTIYFTPGKDDSLTLVLYAENLGRYPPNTGLLIVHDGDDTYQVRFSADLQQNAAVIFRRKKN